MTTKHKVIVQKNGTKHKMSAAEKMRNRKPLGKKSRYFNGYFKVELCTNYNGAIPCQYRSGLELKYFNTLCNSKDVLYWESEPDLGIKYLFNGKEHEYVVDVKFTKVFSDGSRKTFISEIKPWLQTQEPKLSAAKNMKSYQFEKDRFDRNYAKWEAAHIFAQKHGMKFIIQTDKNI